LCPPLDAKTLRSGLATFVIALPIVTAANLAWMELLTAVGLPVEQQDLLKIFIQTDSTPMLVLMIGLATVVAPVAEELLFRATIFRYVRTRVPRWIALVIPGLIFAALHVNWTSRNLEGLPSFVPLVTLAVIFSIAYERTGRIGTAMVAHGLFNFHTILLLFAGVTQ
jgi:membrane protease YdiL (CAAX protease family)